MTTETITREAPAIESPVEPKPSPMKLSEAMRLGSMGTVQAVGTWSREGPDGKAEMCAVSTAWYALTGQRETSGMDTPLSSMLSGVRVIHPVTGKGDDLLDIVVTLNDTHHWPRHKIADWLGELGL